MTTSYAANGVMVRPAYSEAKLRKALDAPGCGGPGFCDPFFPAWHVFTTYGIAYPAGVFGNGTQQTPFFNFPGSGRRGSEFVTTRLPAVVRPAETVIITDGLTGTTGGSRRGFWIMDVGCQAAEMHQGGGNHVFLDGHAKWIAGQSQRYLKQGADGKWFALYYTYDME
jgi:prepilin-type processing-associated H-X9-DG protein